MMIKILFKILKYTKTNEMFFWPSINVIYNCNVPIKSILISLTSSSKLSNQIPFKRNAIKIFQIQVQGHHNFNITIVHIYII